MVSEINLEMENKKPFFIEVTSLNGVSLPIENEIPSHNQEVESSSTDLPGTAAELITIAPVPIGSESDQKIDNASSCTIPETKIDVPDKTQVEVPSFSDHSDNVLFNYHNNDCPTNCSKKSGETENASWTSPLGDDIIEPAVGKALDDTNISQCKRSGENQEMTQELADIEESYSRNCRSCCTTFACGLLSVGLVIFSPLIVAGVFLYEIFGCVRKCKDPCPA
ncbi:uncharacterized protein LOC121281549 [Carcharodon carcharias]|uniref:uncharacterized protein LOC121281549 n=1 Tax=Carcharodon carcharias TaxID=13397 RepID=UPI001B7EB9CE|nr:uncharacterized protein LOC121281549 [Carcharodon carcharias]